MNRDQPIELAQRQRVAVLPFRNLERQAPGPSYGIALADAVAARLSRESSLTVMSGSISRSNTAESYQQLGASHLVQGSFLRTERGFTISWQLMRVSPPSVLSGGALSVNSFDLLGIRKAICDALLSALQPHTGVAATTR